MSARHGTSSGCGRRKGLQYGEWLWKYCISSRGQPTRGGSTFWGLGERLPSPHYKNVSCTKFSHKVQNSTVKAAAIHAPKDSSRSPQHCGSRNPFFTIYHLCCSVLNCTDSAANCAAVGLQFIVLLFILWYWQLSCGDVWCSYWLGEREGNGKGYRMGFVCAVMWWCVVWLLVGEREGNGKSYRGGFYVL